ncbi:MAG: nucleoside-diphosphate kinase [Chloroflexi bacterium]|nr:nucleoside-diphosphate kinase [Chloroflexota bacterium]MDA1173460.1 nucleoside-diphosphate kinase [Chloroflexota bacterium]
MADRTLVLLKPDTLQRGLAGRIISRLEDRGMQIVGMKLMQMDMDLAKQHYAEHVEKGFFKGLSSFMTSSPIIAMAIEGNNAAAAVRACMGETDPQKSLPGTIRGDMAQDLGRNLIHGSDSPESAAREIAIFFKPEELLSYERDTQRWITEA